MNIYACEVFQQKCTNCRITRSSAAIGVDCAASPEGPENGERVNAPVGCPRGRRLPATAPPAAAGGSLDGGRTMM
jgi:hypothetical protein